jgi:hypothetical protein
MHDAALPGRAEHLADRVLEALVRVGDNQLHAREAALDERAEEVAPERLGLCLAAVDADHLAPTRLVHPVRDHQALPDDAAAVADLLDLRVQPKVRVAAYREFEPRAEAVTAGRGSNAELVRSCVRSNLSDAFTFTDVKRAFPGVSDEYIGQTCSAAILAVLAIVVCPLVGVLADTTSPSATGPYYLTAPSDAQLHDATGRDPGLECLLKR